MSPPPGIAGAPAFSGLSATIASVVRNSAAIEAAFCERRAGDLGGVHDSGLEEVAVLAGRGVEALARAERADLLDHDATLEAGVASDDLERAPRVHA